MNQLHASLQCLTNCSTLCTHKSMSELWGRRKESRGEERWGQEWRGEGIRGRRGRGKEGRGKEGRRGGGGRRGVGGGAICDQEDHNSIISAISVDTKV